MAITTVAVLIKTARGRRSQQEFALELGVGQSVVSRYESGKASPPIRIIEHCMRVVHGGAAEVPPSAAELAGKVLRILDTPDLGGARSVLSDMIDALSIQRMNPPGSAAPAP